MSIINSPAAVIFTRSRFSGEADPIEQRGASRSERGACVHTCSDGGMDGNCNSATEQCCRIRPTPATRCPDDTYVCVSPSLCNNGLLNFDAQNAISTQQPTALPNVLGHFQPTSRPPQGGVKCFMDVWFHFVRFAPYPALNSCKFDVCGLRGASFLLASCLR
ncbi:hypothetical protein ZHAS_00017288 [Anopheles sinensis]|uniref:Uncharacterized protein n=1 Tax=Anopheles sinensis TaxID=74873 RepID=A0A084WFZ0_ANOSI|nr:hypothetical protein ZHAS_00017288 [Anopheles sinensis]